MNPRTLKERLSAGRSALAVTINFVHAGLAEYLGRLGCDVLIVDGEHGPVVDREIEDFARACDVCGTTALLRLPFDAMRMERYLAMGVGGFQVPRVQSAEEARAVVAATKFPPVGRRGLGVFRAAGYGTTLGDWPGYMAKANATTLIKIMVEDEAGLAALPGIVAIPEVDIVVVGWLDLSGVFGVPGDIRHPRVVEAFRKAAGIITGAGKILGIGIGGPADIAAGQALGARYFITSASALLAQGTLPLRSALPR